AGVIERARGCAVWECFLVDQVAADDVQRVETQLDGNALHKPFKGEIDLGATKAANKGSRHLVGEADPVGHIQMPDIIRAGQRTVHAVERSGHRSTKERAVILKAIHAEAVNLAILV